MQQKDMMNKNKVPKKRQLNEYNGETRKLIWRISRNYSKMKEYDGNRKLGNERATEVNRVSRYKMNESTHSKKVRLLSTAPIQSLITDGPSLNMDSDDNLANCHLNCLAVLALGLLQLVIK
jgi:hypothetical protein